MEVSELLTGFELEDLMSWTVSNLQRPFREDFSLEKSGIIAYAGLKVHPDRASWCIADGEMVHRHR